MMKSLDPSRVTPSSSFKSGAFEKQNTLKGSVKFSGIGVHTNRSAKLVVHPADPNTGIVFRRTDLDSSSNEISALWSNISNTRLATNIANSHGASVSTIEHMMAALAGLGIDNAIVEIDGPELPILDGSAHPFFFMLECRGLQEQSAPKRFLKVKKSVEVRVGDNQKVARINPNDIFNVDCHILFENQLIGEQRICLDLDKTSFHSHLSRARTFGFLHQVEELQSQGLALGGSLEGGIVLDGDTLMNKEGLRFSDEFVRHKALDLVGDLYLMGYPLLGNVYTWRGGHDLHARLLAALMSDTDAWELIEKPKEIKAQPQPLKALSRLAAAS